MTIHTHFVGRLGQDAELRHVPSGQQVLTLSVAVTTRVQREEVTQWIRVSLWGSRGEALQRYLPRGREVAVTGRLTVREYDSRGERRVALECDASDIALVGKMPEGAAGTSSERRAPQHREAHWPPPEAGPIDDDDSALPF